jgi:hypothetical protein
MFKHQKIILRMSTCRCGCGGLTHRRSIRRDVRFVERHPMSLGTIEDSMRPKETSVAFREVGEIQIGRQTVLVGRLAFREGSDLSFSSWYALK